MGERDEATVLLKYAMSGSGAAWEPAVDEQRIYIDALRIQVPSTHALDPVVLRHPILLGGLDVLARLFYPRSILRSKLIVALALTEYNVASAGWLLPRERGVARWLFDATRVSLKFVAKALLGVSLLVLCRGFVRRNVAPV